MKKKSIKKSATQFLSSVDEIVAFAHDASDGLSKTHESWVYDYAVIRLFRAFEHLMLISIAGSINSDSRALSDALGVEFPKHIQYSVCEYIVTNGRYFDFRGRDGLIKQLTRYLGSDHWLTEIIKQHGYKEPLTRLIALRNFAAHDSEQARSSVKSALGVARLRSSGSWLKTQGRLMALAQKLKQLGEEIEHRAPY